MHISWVFVVALLFIVASEAVNDKSKDLEEHESDCGICCQPLSKLRPSSDKIKKYRWRCNHGPKYCKDCMKTWIDRSLDCPLCRTPLKDVRYFKRFRKQPKGVLTLEERQQISLEEAERVAALSGGNEAAVQQNVRDTLVRTGNTGFQTDQEHLSDMAMLRQALGDAEFERVMSSATQPRLRE